MEALYILIPMSVGVVFFAIWLFFKASDGGQFDDLVGPAMRILHDDDSTHLPEEAEQGEGERQAETDTCGKNAQIQERKLESQ